MSEETPNPFPSLVSEQADNKANEEGTSSGHIQNSSVPVEAQKINNIIQNIFYFTLNPEVTVSRAEKQLVFIEELAESLKPCRLLDLDNLEHALFERILLTSPEKHIVPKGSKIVLEDVVQKRLFIYLYKISCNINEISSRDDEIVKMCVVRMRDLIFRNAVTALKQPELFEGQEFDQQILELLENNCDSNFVYGLAEHFVNDGDPNSYNQLCAFFKIVLHHIYQKIQFMDVMSLDTKVLDIIELFVGHETTASILLDAITPLKDKNGRAYQDTLFGSVLALSVLPKAPYRQMYFDNPLDMSAVSLEEQSLWNATKYMTDRMHRIFLQLLKCNPNIKNRLLKWIGDCLKANVGKAKLWNMQAMSLQESVTQCSDGFMINLGTVLLKLCQPFCSQADDPKSLKIDPTYCAVKPDECESKSVHINFLHDWTCLLPRREGTDGATIQPYTSKTYNFVTECFFMAHTSIHLGYNVCAEKQGRLIQDIARNQRALGIEGVRERMNILMKSYVRLRCALMSPDIISMLSLLHAVTCNWLVQVAVRSDPEEPLDSYAPVTFVEVNMPITTRPPDTLRCIPEFLVENITTFVSMARRSDSLSETDASILYPAALTLVLTFMGDAERMNNPHLRARLAECLEAMLPSHPDDQQPTRNNLAIYFKEQLFKKHPHRLQLVPSLLDVFVGIEMTGQSVQFEQKFNYRRPMYIVMDFLWEMEEHRDCFTKLAREAESNMEAVRPPIFLRFVNLLMNDAIFLLDEALNNMAQMRTLQAAQDAGEWANLPPNEREQNLSNLAHIGMIARFDNILGRDTIKALVRMTEHAPYVFCHPTMVDRIAAMLNYFLFNLVGPNKKNFKVKDGKEYEFSPAETVLNICHMYVQLGNDEKFCSAVSADGRSYSPTLFNLAEAVLVRIGGGLLIGELQEVAARVARLAELKQVEEEILADAPDEFLDPIMSTLMMDPVLLPSSRKVLDRTTIARHLLSDESDPFNRSPLTMDQVIPDVELRTRIQAWIEERKQANRNSKTSIVQ